jgi:hypothetical protein
MSSVEEERMIRLREERNYLLSQCDWTQVVDSVLANKEEWKTYRQALRDLPSNVELTSDDFSNVFPQKPE